MRKRVALFFMIAMIVLFSLMPFLWFVLTSLKSQIEVTAIPPVFLPSGTLYFYKSAIVKYHLLSYVKNSVIVSTLTTIITVTTSVLAGYSIARLSLPYKRLILGSLLIVSMFPQISIAGPVWTVLQRAGLLNTYAGLIIPYVTLTLPLGVWILVSYFNELPAEIEKAAMVDGCGYVGALVRVILPMSTPGIFTAFILVFIYAWNEFFFALLIMTQKDMQPLSVGIALFQGQYTLPWGELAAASTVATVPLVLVVFLFQKRIISGLSAGAVKG